MSSEIEMLRLLGSEGGIKMLLHSGRDLGIIIKTSNWSNIVDFGVFSRESLSRTVPLGYEEDDTRESAGYLFHPVTLSLDKDKGKVDVFSIDSYLSLPNKNEKTFSLHLITEHGEDASSLILEAGKPLQLIVRLSIHPEYIKGYIDEFLLLSFSGETRHSQVCRSYAECTIGLRVQGTLMAPNEMILSQQLSAEAAPFTPKIALTYFDAPCRPTFLLAMSSANDCYMAPQGFRSVRLVEMQVVLSISLYLSLCVCVSLSLSFFLLLFDVLTCGLFYSQGYAELIYDYSNNLLSPPDLVKKVR
jgi:hypothetical protein